MSPNQHYENCFITQFQDKISINVKFELYSNFKTIS